ncbi:type II secretion system major pseudopilin GspG [Agaribacter marinus]|uniref:Type II secretion system core protein G n=1 Tax=Agaribacter marinus TaxID=1431249 RepID=A0AA37SYG9_9ALTE|nr:type II secretion system major pseudopilin GspG [Agaribacter marinus]GLR70874.1 type II secretion system protein GspG [Agaribacter marinus]
MKIHRHKSKNTGFSIIELLVVLVILGLLAGIVGQQFIGKAESSKVPAAETQIKVLKMALQTYRLDVGAYPDELKYLNTKPSERNKYWAGPYLDDELPLDPWHNDYVYKRDASAPQGFYLYSKGADGQDGGDDLNADVGYVPQV